MKRNARSVAPTGGMPDVIRNKWEVRIQIATFVLSLVAAAGACVNWWSNANAPVLSRKRELAMRVAALASEISHSNAEPNNLDRNRLVLAMRELQITTGGEATQLLSADVNASLASFCELLQKDGFLRTGKNQAELSAANFGLQQSLRDYYEYLRTAAGILAG